MKPIFLPKAEEEFREAARYYENEAPGLGLLFIAEVQKTITFIMLPTRKGGLDTGRVASRK